MWGLVHDKYRLSCSPICSVLHENSQTRSWLSRKRSYAGLESIGAFLLDSESREGPPNYLISSGCQFRNLEHVMRHRWITSDCVLLCSREPQLSAQKAGRRAAGPIVHSRLLLRRGRRSSRLTASMHSNNSVVDNTRLSLRPLSSVAAGFKA